MDLGSSMSEEGPGVTSHPVRQPVGRTGQRTLFLGGPGRGGGGGGGGGEGKGIDVMLAYRLPGKPAEGHSPPHPYDKRSGEF